MLMWFLIWSSYISKLLISSLTWLINNSLYRYSTSLYIYFTRSVSPLLPLTSCSPTCFIISSVWISHPLICFIYSSMFLYASDVVMLAIPGMFVLINNAAPTVATVSNNFFIFLFTCKKALSFYMIFDFLSNMFFLIMHVSSDLINLVVDCQCI